MAKSYNSIQKPEKSTGFEWKKGEMSILTIFIPIFKKIGFQMFRVFEWLC